METMHNIKKVAKAKHNIAYIPSPTTDAQIPECKDCGVQGWINLHGLDCRKITPEEK